MHLRSSKIVQGKAGNRQCIIAKPCASTELPRGNRVKTDVIIGFYGVGKPPFTIFPDFIGPREGQEVGTAPRGGGEGR